MTFFASKKPRRDRGASLIAVMVAAGVSVMVAAGLSTMFSNSAKLQTKTDLEVERSSIASALLMNVDCAKSMAPYCGGGACTTGASVTCPASGYITLYRKSAVGNPVSVSAAGTTQGKWTMRASCVAGLGIDVRVARLRPGAAISSNNVADFYPDPVLANTALSFSHPKSALYPSASYMCQQYFTAASAPSYTCPGGMNCTTSGKNVIVDTPLNFTGILCGYVAAVSAGCVGYHYTSYPFCPAGYTVQGGGANCQFTNDGGFQLMSIPSGTNAWFTDCCVTHCPGVYAASAPTAFATCTPN